RRKMGDARKARAVLPQVFADDSFRQMKTCAHFAIARAEDWGVDGQDDGFAAGIFSALDEVFGDLSIGRRIELKPDCVFCTRRNSFDRKSGKRTGRIDGSGLRGTRGGREFAVFVIETLVGGWREEQRVDHLLAKQGERGVKAADVA